jgi:vacuolar protein sorting-associated protein 54
LTKNYSIRLLADAKYLQQKFSALKNVGTSNWMLETVITEKNLPRTNATPGPSTPTRSNTLSANQRLKGLLSGKSSSFDKPMPIPTGTDLPPPIPPSADKPRLLLAPTTTANNAHDQHHNMELDRSTHESQVTLGLSVSPPNQIPAGLPEGAGFRQVELSSSNARLEEETLHPKDK